MTVTGHAYVRTRGTRIGASIVYKPRTFTSPLSPHLQTSLDQSGLGLLVNESALHRWRVNRKIGKNADVLVPVSSTSSELFARYITLTDHFSQTELYYLQHLKNKKRWMWWKEEEGPYTIQKPLSFKA